MKLARVNALDSKREIRQLMLLIVVALILGGVAGGAVATELWLLVGALVLLSLAVLGYNLSALNLGRLYLLLAILTPSFLLGGIMPFRLEDAVTILLIVKFGPALLRHQPRTVRTLVGLFVAFMAISFFGMFLGSIILAHTPSLRDFFTIVGVIRMLLTVLIGSAIAQNMLRRGDSPWSFLDVAVLGVTLSALVGYMQYFNLFGSAAWLVPLFRSRDPKSYAEAMVGGWISRRAIGTVGNPNYFALLSLFGLAPAMLRAVGARERGRRFRYGLCAVIMSLALLLALSRTGWLAGLTVLVLIVYLMRRARGSLGYAKRLMGVALVLTVCYFLLPEGVLAGFRVRVDRWLEEGFLTEHNLVARWTHWANVFQDVLRSPVFGLGPAKGAVPQTVDNGFLKILRTTGIVGLGVWLGILSLPAIAALRKIKGADRASFVIRVWAIGIIVVFMVYGITSDVFGHTQLMGLAWLTVGFCLGWIGCGRLEGTPQP